MGVFAGRRVWIILLIASLLANGVLAGVLIQRKVNEARVEAPAERVLVRGPFNPRAFIAALPEDRQEAARRDLREGLRDVRPLFRQSFEARRRANQAMAAAEFDPDAVLASMAEFRALRAEIDAAGEQVILAIVADLDAETRAAALEAAYGPRGRDRRGWRGRERREGRDAPEE